MENGAAETVIIKVDKGTEEARRLLEFAESFSWVEVREHVVKGLLNWEFEDWETPFAAVADGRIVGMAAIMKSDYYPLPGIFPWVTTIFVSEEYRGRRLSEKLIEHANRYALSLGFTRTYIPSEYTGLYEKYGYRYVRDIINYGGGTDRLYVKDLK